MMGKAAFAPDLSRAPCRALSPCLIPTVVHRATTPKNRRLQTRRMLQPHRILLLLFAILAVSAAAEDAADPCLAEDYAEANYGTCCAQGGYKKPGHGDVCKVVGPKVKSKKEL